MKRRIASVVLAAALTACGTHVNGQVEGVVTHVNRQDQAVTVRAKYWGSRTFWVCPRAASRLRVGDLFNINDYFDHQRLYCR